MKKTPEGACGSLDHVSRRTLLKLAGLAGLTWLTPISELLALEDEKAPKGKPAKSVIILWMGGAPSQLETFDPHPGSKIAYGSKAIKTALKGVQLGEGFDHTAELMSDITLVRSVMSKEADHERAVYNIKTGYRPSPTVVHPSIGAVICHELSDTNLEIPRHISILPGQWPARGGFFGAQFDAFQISDPQGPVTDVVASVPKDRLHQRMNDLSVVERNFAKGRTTDLETRVTLHQA